VALAVRSFNQYRVPVASDIDRYQVTRGSSIRRVSHLGFLLSVNRQTKGCSYLRWLAFCRYYGPELTSETFTAWCRSRDIELRFIQPGKPDQNAYIERFNRTYREEVLSAYLFDSLDQVRDITAEWLEQYNEIRPHDALGSLPPARYRERLLAVETPV
jgi:hypothetical protein